MKSKVGKMRRRKLLILDRVKRIALACAQTDRRLSKN